MDYSDKDRRRAMEIIDLFREEDTRDELGIGVIRDAFADHFFPGTNTIQTRVRYFLFIPWVFQSVNAEDNEDGFTKKIRNRQHQLCEALKTGGESLGVIGYRAGRAVQRLPSNIYWHGLQRWGVLRFAGSETDYGRCLSRQRHSGEPLRNDDGEIVSSAKRNFWDPGLPEPADGWPKRASFSLRRKEAWYLAERINRSAGGSMLDWLIRHQLEPGESRFVWEHVHPEALDATQVEEIAHARNFSESIHGAALLYNLMLAEKADWPERVVHYEEWIDGWWSHLQDRSAELRGWNRDRFWALLQERLVGRALRCRVFVDDWINAIGKFRTVGDVLGDRNLRDLIRHREQLIKGKRARLGNPRALDNWNGSSGALQLDYRWGSPVCDLLRDVVRGLRGKE